MTGRNYDKPLYISMDFEEALQRFGTTDAKELPDNIKLSRKGKRRAQKKPDKKPQTTVKSK